MKPTIQESIRIIERRTFNVNVPVECRPVLLTEIKDEIEQAHEIMKKLIQLKPQMAVGDLKILKSVQTKMGQIITGWNDSKLFLFSYDIRMMLCTERGLLKRANAPNESQK